MHWLSIAGALIIVAGILRIISNDIIWVALPLGLAGIILCIEVALPKPPKQ